MRTFGDGAVERPAPELVGVRQPRPVQVPVPFAQGRPLPPQGLDLVVVERHLFRQRQPHAVVVVDDPARFGLFHEDGRFRQVLVGAVGLDGHETFQLDPAIVDVDAEKDVVPIFVSEPHGGQRPDDLDVLVPFHGRHSPVARLQLLAGRGRL